MTTVPPWMTLLLPVIPHLWGTDNGMAYLRALGLQKGELLKLLPVLPNRHLPPMLGISHHFTQDAGVLLGHLSGPALLRKLALKEGDLLDKAFGILAGRG
jgi:hypothetical protein